MLALVLLSCLGASVLWAVPDGAPADEDLVYMRTTGVPVKAESTSLSRRIGYLKFKMFSDAHPNVRYISTTPLELQGIEGGAENRLLLQMATQRASDSISVNVKSFDDYLRHGFMYPLNEFLEREEFAWVAEHVTRYPVIADLVTRDGVVYAIPGNPIVMGLLYRKDLYRGAGIPVDAPPRDWDEFYDYLVRLRDKDRGTYGYAMYSNGDGMAWHFINFIWQSGSEIIETDAKGEARAVYDNEKAARALDFLRSWVREDIVLFSNDAPLQFEGGKVAMWVSYVSPDVNTFGDELADPIVLGVAPLPRGPDGDYGAELNCVMSAINASQPDPRVREMAFRSTAFSLRPEVSRMVTGEYVKAGMAKYFSRDRLIADGYADFVDEVLPEWDATLSNIFSVGKPEPHGRGVKTVYQELGHAMDKARREEEERVIALRRGVEPPPRTPSIDILRESARRFNEEVIGVRDPVVRRHRNRVTGLAMGAVLVVFVTCIGLFGRTISGTARRSAQTSAAFAAASGGRRRKRVEAWAFMFPALFSIALWGYYPLARGSVMAFQDYRIIGQSAWVGLSNFADVFYGASFRIAVRNTLYYAGLSLSLGFITPIVLALALSEVPRGKRLFRTVYYLPAVTTGLVIMFLWKWFYHPTEDGFLNTLIMPLAGWLHANVSQAVSPGPFRWLDDPSMAMVCVVIPQVWAGAGPGSLIYLAALKSIPDDLYEAADVDGAGTLRKVRSITLPMIAPMILINFIGAFIGGFKAMGNILVLTGGGPNYATHVLGLEIWSKAFRFLRFGYATSVAWILGSMLIGFTVVQVRLLSRAKFRTAEKVEV